MIARSRIAPPAIFFAVLVVGWEAAIRAGGGARNAPRRKPVELTGDNSVARSLSLHRTNRSRIR